MRVENNYDGFKSSHESFLGIATWRGKLFSLKLITNLRSFFFFEVGGGVFF
jgi:hypothetical protein